jgi:hypothetical protein
MVDDYSGGEVSVVVIGSGLSAIGAIKALRSLGIKPTVIDFGQRLEADRARKVEFIAKSPPGDWGAEERDWLNHNHTLKSDLTLPKKLEFGSEYFYGSTRTDAPIQAEGNIPPFSYALGGLSAGWGAAALPPQACDIADWPVDAEELRKYCEIVLEGMPYSAVNDGLSLNFPILNPATKALRPSRADSRLLEWLDKAGVLKKDWLVFGQSRLMVSPESTSSQVGCKYCGQCMSGCVYKSIYKAGDEVLALHREGAIEYVSGCLVERLTETDAKVVVSYLDADGRSCSRTFDKVFLAAGAVNSARVVLNSLDIYDQQVRLKSRGGFVVPVFSFRKLPVEWPNCNTQPGLFMEFKGRSLKHWVHLQISTENELLLQRLGIAGSKRGVVGRFMQFVAGHVFLLFVNYHSDHAGTYEMRIVSAGAPGKKNTLHTQHRKSFLQAKVLWVTVTRLMVIFTRIFCITLLPFAKLNSGAYHVGGTLPMKANREGKLDTDILGRVNAWEHIHVVDTSVFPSLPGTTIGLLAMANAYRIVDKTMAPSGPEVSA